MIRYNKKYFIVMATILLQEGRIPTPSDIRKWYPQPKRDENNKPVTRDMEEDEVQFVVDLTSYLIEERNAHNSHQHILDQLRLAYRSKPNGDSLQLFLRSETSLTNTLQIQLTEIRVRYTKSVLRYLEGRTYG